MFARDCVIDAIAPNGPIASREGLSEYLFALNYITRGIEIYWDAESENFSCDFRLLVPKIFRELGFLRKNEAFSGSRAF